MPARKTPNSRHSSGTAAPPGTLLVPEKPAALVHYLRHEKVMLDSDLAELYGVEARVLNQAVKRNIRRFPSDFMFQLNEKEAGLARSSSSQSVTLRNPEDTGAPANSSQTVMSSRKHRGRAYLPCAFTEQGVALLSSVLRSERAVEVNIAIMRTFVQLRRLMDSNALLAEKIEALQEKYTDHDQQLQLVFEAIKQLIASPTPPTKELGFHTLPSARSAKKSTKA